MNKLADLVLCLLDIVFIIDVVICIVDNDKGLSVLEFLGYSHSHLFEILTINALYSHELHNVLNKGVGPLLLYVDDTIIEESSFVQEGD